METINLLQDGGSRCTTRSIYHPSADLKIYRDLPCANTRVKTTTVRTRKNMTVNKMSGEHLGVFQETRLTFIGAINCRDSLCAFHLEA